MKAEIKLGCLLKAFKNKEVEVIIHCCNCHNNMGSGIARSIREMFPEAYKADQKTIKSSKDKLGTYSMASNEYGYIINLYAQYDYGGKKVHLEYDALKKGLITLKSFCDAYDIPSIGMPYLIGCDRAGGNFEKVTKIVNDIFQESDINVTFYRI